MVVFGTINPSDSAVVFAAAVHEPARRFADALAFYFSNYGPSIASVTVGSCPAGAQTIGLAGYAPLSRVMKHCLLESDNLEAELYMRQLGLLGDGPDNYENGRQIVKSYLSSIGVVDEFVQTDGSGLGRSNQLTPNGLVGVLADMFHEEWVDYLPVGGESGTLRNRFQGTNGAVKVAFFFIFRFFWFCKYFRSKGQDWVDDGSEQLERLRDSCEWHSVCVLHHQQRKLGH